MKPSSTYIQVPEKDIPSREIGVAHNVVKGFLNAHPTFRGYDFEDLIQECLLHWLAQRHQYNPKLGASRTTFMGKILRRKLLDILDSQMSHKRRINQLTETLDPPSEEEDPEEAIPLPYQDPDEEKNRLYLRLALEKTLAELHPDQVKLCELLKQGNNISDVSRQLKKPRSTIYDEIKRIREIFHKEGLSEFI